ncbi:3-hydroxyacyl-CoA dehydrogenase [Roseovarius aestuarii]|nr:3-hydroxyacyl-CoA dehydrogenase [Roseovarius aestuarii]
MSYNITIVGGGLIGRAWAVAFAKGGCQVTVWDLSGDILEGFQTLARDMVVSMDQAALLDASVDTVMGRIKVEPDLETALADCDFVQESAPEKLDVKRGLFAQLDALAPTSAILSSSSSALLPSAIFDGLAGQARCVVCHPLNPPYLIPAIEIVPSPAATDATMAKAEEIMRSIGQSPIVMKREIDAFVMNRLQGALLDEAFNLVGRGYATAEEIDVSIRDGLALRWSVMGPFETIDLNAPGGVRDYVERYAGIYENVHDTKAPRVDWKGDVLDQIETERRAALAIGDIAERQLWRDQRLMELMAFRNASKTESK